MKEVVRKEVLKLLDVGIIYSIADSSWVSPVQVVPNKGGMTVVKNNNIELIPSCTITGRAVNGPNVQRTVRESFGGKFVYVLLFNK